MAAEIDDDRRETGEDVCNVSVLISSLFIVLTNDNEEGVASTSVLEMFLGQR
jgi:hypothetical protein